MCGRVTLTSSAREIAEQFALDATLAAERLAPRYNVAPGQDVATVREDADGRRVLDFERWGLVPHWARDPSIGGRLINARAETVATKPAFRDAFLRRRCLVPVDGFYEWSGTGASRRPWLFRRPDRRLLAIAGLYERWHGAGGEVVDTCTLITTDANATLAGFHDRMPVILAPEDYGRWLDRDLRDPDSLQPLLAPCPEPWLEPAPVSTRINDVRNDDPDCWVPEPTTGNLFG